MIKIIYTGKKTKEDVINELDQLLSRFIDELNKQSKIGVDEG